MSLIVIVMGVSGSGKTTVAQGIAKAMGWEFAEGDDFHSAANVAKMSSGQPLTDDDRWPWLRAIADWIGAHERAGTSAVITCSALKRSYRDLLRSQHPDVRFCHVTVDPEVIKARLDKREGHYMPPSLLPSQLATLEALQPDEPGVEVSSAGDRDDVLDEVLRKLNLDVGGRRADVQGQGS